MPKNKTTKGGRQRRIGTTRGRARRPTGTVTRKTAPLAHISRTAYSINSRSRDSAIISGRDMLGSLHAKAGTIAFCASPNPVTWPGTRISAAARGYANWKPLRLQLHYVTSTNTTKSGTGVIGTVFGEQDVDPFDYANLLTSNGGVQFQVWTDCTTTIDCRRLTQNRYYISDQHGPESCPFRIFAVTQGLDAGTDADYGSIFVDYTFELSNPLVQETFPMGMPGGQPQAFTVVAGAAGTTMKVKSAVGMLREIVDVAHTMVGATNLLKAGNPYHTFAIPAPAGVANDPANPDYYYTLAEAYDGEPMLLPVTLEADVPASGFFWFQGEKAAY